MEINSNLDKYIKVFDDVMPLTALHNLIKICKERKEFNPALVGGKTLVLDTEMRKTFAWNMENLKESSMTTIHWTNYLYFLFEAAIKEYQKKYKISGRCIIQDIQILKYLVGGFYKFHVDHAGDSPRTISCIYFLNDDFEGGDLLFNFPNVDSQYKIKHKKNRMIVWPSNFLFPHCVTPVTEGERYSVVSWAL